jgi:3-phenylpropionate/trans-cinnamate dioxygenase ferredoxin subunit
VEATFQKLCGVDEPGENQIIEVEIKGKNILVTRINGEFYAVENRCTHENLALTGGQIYGGQIQCPHHGARFDIKTGKATQFPAVMDLKTYEVKIDNNNIMVAL